MRFVKTFRDSTVDHGSNNWWSLEKMELSAFITSNWHRKSVDDEKILELEQSCIIVSQHDTVISWIFIEVDPLSVSDKGRSTCDSNNISGQCCPEMCCRSKIKELLEFEKNTYRITYQRDTAALWISRQVDLSLWGRFKKKHIIFVKKFRHSIVDQSSNNCWKFEKGELSAFISSNWPCKAVDNVEKVEFVIEL